MPISGVEENTGVVLGNAQTAANLKLMKSTEIILSKYKVTNIIKCDNTKGMLN
jgi:hypothetical protein